ncbi:MAG TPA: hypothetical protein VF832_17380 [Longimicrobiales bacterium]
MDDKGLDSAIMGIALVAFFGTIWFTFVAHHLSRPLVNGRPLEPEPKRVFRYRLAGGIIAGVALLLMEVDSLPCSGSTLAMLGIGVGLTLVIHSQQLSGSWPRTLAAVVCAMGTVALLLYAIATIATARTTSDRALGLLALIGSALSVFLAIRVFQGAAAAAAGARAFDMSGAEDAATFIRRLEQDEAAARAAAIPGALPPRAERREPEPGGPISGSHPAGNPEHMPS